MYLGAEYETMVSQACRRFQHQCMLHRPKRIMLFSSRAMRMRTRSTKTQRINFLSEPSSKYVSTVSVEIPHTCSRSELEGIKCTAAASHSSSFYGSSQCHLYITLEKGRYQCWANSRQGVAFVFFLGRRVLLRWHWRLLGRVSPALHWRRILLHSRWCWHRILCPCHFLWLLRPPHANSPLPAGHEEARHVL